MVAEPRVGGRAEIVEVARLFPDARDYVDVYDKAGASGRARSWPTRSTSRRARRRACETGRGAIADLELFIGAGVMRWRTARGRDPGGAGSDVSGGAELSIFGHARRRYAQQARRALADGDDGASAVLDRSTGCGWDARRGSGARAG